MLSKEPSASRYQTKGGGHTKVGRPGIGTGAPEGALRMATINTVLRKRPHQVTLCVNATGLPNPITVFSDRETIKARP